MLKCLPFHANAYNSLEQCNKNNKSLVLLIWEFPSYCKWITTTNGKSMYSIFQTHFSNTCSKIAKLQRLINTNPIQEITNLVLHSRTKFKYPLLWGFSDDKWLAILHKKVRITVCLITRVQVNLFWIGSLI